MTAFTPLEDAYLVSMRCSGMKLTQVARKLNRTYKSVLHRAQRLNAVKFTKIKLRPLPANTLTQTIEKHELPAYYAVGWRVSWFEGNQVGIERKA